jgi:hypothetical protein
VVNRAPLEQLLEEIAAGLTSDRDSGPAIDQVEDEATVIWARDGTIFAVLGDAGVELRLDPPIAAAAARTPDTAPSPRGSEWVRFNPRAIDPHAVDRLEAWFRLAARLAFAGHPTPD